MLNYIFSLLIVIWAMGGVVACLNNPPNLKMKSCKKFVALIFYGPLVWCAFIVAAVAVAIDKITEIIGKI